MQKIGFSIFLSCIVLLFPFFAFGACEKGESFDLKKEVLALREETRSAIESCIEARKKNKESSITDFSCPSGDTIAGTNQPFTNEVLAYQVAVAKVFAKIDESAEKYMKELSACREQDSVVWTEDIRKNIEWTANQDGYTTWYRQACSFGFLEENILRGRWEGETTYTLSTNLYPQSDFCLARADKKADAWTKMGYILMGQGIAKSYQNDKDIFAESVKWAYKKLLDKFHSYVMIIDRAVSKMTGYNKETN